MDILVSSDKRYLRQTSTMLFSLMRNTAEDVRVWFLDGGLSVEDKESFSTGLQKMCGATVSFIALGEKLTDSLNFPLSISHISRATYFRLVAPYILPEALERIMWLDSDIIVKSDLSPFYHQNLEGLYLIACENTGGRGHEKRLGLPEDSVYFNAGVMLMNLPLIRERCGMDELLDFCETNKDRIPLQDQDLLNLLYHEKCKVLLGGKYNCMSNQSRLEDAADASVIHYAGWQKPWKFRWQDGFSRYWWEVREEIGMTAGERFTRFFGNIWKCLGVNKLIRLILMPYNWALARLRK